MTYCLIMSNSAYSIIDIILENLFNPRALLPRPYETLYTWARRNHQFPRAQFHQSIRRMRQRGLITIVEKNNQKFIKLTSDGQLKALLDKARFPAEKRWDGKWRLFMFDIPEDSKEKRSLLRFLLKQNGYCKLQASVYISPYPLNREAILYLNNSGLRSYIRILKVEELDYDKDLLKRFNLQIKE